MTSQHFKDEKLDELAAQWNVAQFVSFSPDLNQRFSRVLGTTPNERFKDASTALKTLLSRAHEHRVNLRSFKPDSPQGNEFIYAIDRLADAESALRRLTASGLFVIANETIDVQDGGVSGVIQGGLLEFAPGGTPRVVETGRVASLPFDLGMHVLACVYGFNPELPNLSGMRFEFSLHPCRRGFRNLHTVMWEAEGLSTVSLSVQPKWPNAFSEFIGDKVFGLIVAEFIGFCVPRTNVLCRAVAPFLFGKSTDADIKWLRTSPRVPEPGFFPTVRGWVDPFKLMAEHEELAALMIQEEVPALFSGALLSDALGQPIIEGVEGLGTQFMLGQSNPVQLPAELKSRLEEIYTVALRTCGSVRLEWAYDGEHIWILQLQQETAVSEGLWIVPGAFESEVEFDVSNGLEALRELIRKIDGTSVGVKLIGRVGMTSHVADVLRRHNVPSRMTIPTGSSIQ